MTIILEIRITKTFPVLMATHPEECRVWEKDHVTASWDDCTCDTLAEMWIKVGNAKSFIDERDAEVWAERFYPTDVRRIRKV